MMFKRNYFYELPDDIQSVIYRNIFSNCIRYFANDRSIKYLNRLYRAVNNPSNTCVYSIQPMEMFDTYKHLATLEGFRATREANVANAALAANALIYLDRKHLLADISHTNSDTISFYLFPLFTANKTFRNYLAYRLTTLGYYDKQMIANIKVLEDRVELVFTHNFTCNADIYYHIMVGYNVLYNSLSNVIYGEENVLMFSKLIELFKWIEDNNRFEGYYIYNHKIIPVLEGKLKN